MQGRNRLLIAGILLFLFWVFVIPETGTEDDSYNLGVSTAIPVPTSTPISVQKHTKPSTQTSIVSPAPTANEAAAQVQDSVQKPTKISSADSSYKRVLDMARRQIILNEKPMPDDFERIKQRIKQCKEDAKFLRDIMAMLGVAKFDDSMNKSVVRLEAQETEKQGERLQGCLLFTENAQDLYECAEKAQKYADITC